MSQGITWDICLRVNASVHSSMECTCDAITPLLL